MITEDQVEKAVEYLMSSAEAAAKARAEYHYVENFLKVIKAQIMRESNSPAINAQERDALADDRYVAHLDAIKEAEYRDQLHHNRREAAVTAVDAWRTQQATERALKL